MYCLQKIEKLIHPSCIFVTYFKTQKTIRALYSTVVVVVEVVVVVVVGLVVGLVVVVAALQQQQTY